MGYATKELFQQDVDYSSKTLTVSVSGGKRYSFKPIAMVDRENDLNISIEARQTITVLDRFENAHDFQVSNTTNGGSVFADFASMYAFFHAAVLDANS